MIRTEALSFHSFAPPAPPALALDSFGSRAAALKPHYDARLAISDAPVPLERVTFAGDDTHETRGIKSTEWLDGGLRPRDPSKSSRACVLVCVVVCVSNACVVRFSFARQVARSLFSAARMQDIRPSLVTPVSTPARTHVRGRVRRTLRCRQPVEEGIFHSQLSAQSPVLLSRQVGEGRGEPKNARASERAEDGECGHMREDRHTLSRTQRHVRVGQSCGCLSWKVVLRQTGMLGEGDDKLTRENEAGGEGDAASLAF